MITYVSLQKRSLCKDIYALIRKDIYVIIFLHRTRIDHSMRDFSACVCVMSSRMITLFLNASQKKNTVIHCRTLPHTATHCNIVLVLCFCAADHTSPHCNTLNTKNTAQYTAANCRTLQHTATSLWCYLYLRLIALLLTTTH